MSEAKRHMRDILESLGDGVLGAIEAREEILRRYQVEEVGPANLEVTRIGTKR
jgi:hypothetical protein